MTSARCLLRIGSRFLVSHLGTHTSQLPTVQPGVRKKCRNTYRKTTQDHKRHEMGSQRLPKWSKKLPKALKRHPAAPQRLPKGAQVGPRGSQGGLKRARWGSQGLPRGSQGVPKGAPRFQDLSPGSSWGEVLEPTFGGPLKEAPKYGTFGSKTSPSRVKNSKNTRVWHRDPLKKKVENSKNTMV